MTIDKQALRQLATDAHELGIIKRYSKGLEAQRKFYAAATPLVIRALLDELEAAEKRNAELVHNHRVHAARLIDERGQLKQRIADQRGIILSARQFINEYAASGDAGADEFVKVIDRAAGIGKGE